MKFLVVGSGSAAGKFVKHLLDKKHHVFVYRHRPDLKVPQNCSPIDSLKDLSQFDGGIVASPTAFHMQYALPFVKQKLPTLIEKPLSDSLKGVNSLFNLARKNKSIVLTGFNLRFLPIVEIIRKEVAQGKLGKILHADLYVGQYLSEWRPWLDYRKNYSAIHSQGGGVSLDLIHEVDLALHFFPDIKLQSIFSGKLGDLEINTEDFVCFQTRRPTSLKLAGTNNPWISVRMDYLNHIKTRQYRIIGTKASIFCDIFGKTFVMRSKTGKEEIITDPKYFDIPASFEAELDHFIAAIKKKKIEVTKRSLGIDALKLSVAGRRYVQR